MTGITHLPAGFSMSFEWFRKVPQAKAYGKSSSYRWHCVDWIMTQKSASFKFPCPTSMGEGNNNNNQHILWWSDDLFTKNRNLISSPTPEDVTIMIFVPPSGVLVGHWVKEIVLTLSGFCQATRTICSNRSGPNPTILLHKINKQNSTKLSPNSRLRD